MDYLVGHAVCLVCGAADVVVRALDANAAGPTRCSECRRAVTPMVWYPSSYWPTAEALVRFQVAREELGLDSLEWATWH